MSVAASKLIYLRHDDLSPVLVHSALDDRVVVVSAADAVLSILSWGSISAGIASLNEQLRLLLERLQQWSCAHFDRIYRADVQVRSNKDIHFIVTQRDAPHDDILMNDLSEFDLDIFNDPKLKDIRLNTILVPRCSIDSLQAFVNLDRNICIGEFKYA
jgi:hypothetical protein